MSTSTPKPPHGSSRTPPPASTPLFAWLGQTTVHRVVFEPTGAYHRILERQLGNAGVPMIKVSPLQARRFAEAIGQRAKTDAVDAAMLARFGALDALQTGQLLARRSAP